MKTSLKLALLLFLLAISTILGLSQVTATDWDNVKSYDAEKKEVTITNLFGLGKEISQITLLTELNHRVIDRGPNVMQRVAEFRIKNNENYGNALKKMELFDVQRSMKEMDREFEYRYREDNGYEDVPVTNTSYCNGEDECVAPILYYRRDYKYNWIKLEESKLDELPKGNITLGIYLDVEEGERGEWIPTLFGVRINEWAEWTEGLNTYLTHYYHFNESSGTNALDSGGIGKTQVNMTLVPATGVSEFISSGLFGNSVFVDTAATGSYAKTNANIGLSGTDTWFISLWVNRTDPHTDPAFLFGGTSGWPLYFSIKGSGNPSAVRINWAGSDSGDLAACFNSNGSAFNHVLWGQSAGRQLFYCDGTLLWNATFSSTTTNELRIGNQQYLDAQTEINFDEMAVFNHSLTPSQISDLYNNGDGIRYKTIFITPPAISFISPLSQNLTSSQTLEFSSNASDNVEVTNITLIINGVANYTQTGSATTLTFNQSLTLGDGNYDYYFKASDDEGSTASTGNQSIIIDSVAPLINITSPLNDTNYLATQTPFNVTINYTISDINLQSCWYYNGSSNVSLTCGNNITQGLDPGWTYFIIYANDSLGNQNSRAINLFINSLSYGVEYQNTIIEGQNSTFYLNITATNITTLAGNLTYNSTKYSLEEVTNNGTFGRFSRTLTAPFVTADRNHTFNFSFALNGVLFNTSTYSQIVYNIPALVVQSSVCSPAAYNFSLHDEQNLTDINGTFEYNFRYGTTANNTFVSTFGQISNTHELYLCINDSLSSAGNWSLGSGEIFYRSPSYVDRRYYLFEDSELSNKTRNVSLFDLLSTSQTSFKLEVEDTSLSPFVEKFTALLRWYPDLNEYKVVEMGQTDENGNTILHVRTEDVDYRIAVYERNGSLIKLEDPTRFVCLVDPCTYTLRISPGERDFTSIFDLDYSFTFNRSTSIWDLIYSDSSELTTGINLTIYKLTGTSILPICSNIATGSTGAVSCNTSGYTGTLKGVAVRTASPGVALAEKIITTTTTAFSSQFGLWLALLIAIPIVFIFSMMSPIAAVIGGVIAIIPAFYFGAISWAVIGGIIILGGITIHFLKRVG